MFADQTATFQVDGEMEEKEETHQHSGNGTFFFCSYSASWAL